MGSADRCVQRANGCTGSTLIAIVGFATENTEFTETIVETVEVPLIQRD